MFKRTFYGQLILLVLAVLAGFGSFSRPAESFFTTQRSVTISSGVPSATADYLYKYTLPTTADIGSIVFEYCNNSPLVEVPCTPPPGLDINSASLASQTGNTGFSIDNSSTTANTMVLTRAVAPGNAVPSSFFFTGITNPSTPGETVFVRMWTHASNDGSGPRIDGGASAYAVQSIFNVGAFVPPFLRLCVGITVAPDCAFMTGNNIDLGILSSQHASYGQSQFATGTNDPNGYVVFATGTTITSGNNIIAAVPNPAPSFPGTTQFGINLRANLSPPVGQDPVGLGTGVPAANYNIPNRFSYNDGDTIASSPLTTDYNRMTVSYVVNIPSKQAPGIYATTITYVATVQF